jgi:hypothetical protein
MSQVLRFTARCAIITLPESQIVMVWKGGVMSGAVKSGLIFALVGIAVVVGFSFIPIIGAFVCGPLAAGLVGTAAGYFGVRWSDASAGVGTGVLSGAIAGVGGLIGAVIFWLIAFRLVQSMPGFQEQILRSIEQQQPGAQLNPSDINTLIGVIGPALGFCFGIFNLLLALALGALGGWLAVRNRGQMPVVPTMSTPLGPPPLDPPH